MLKSSEENSGHRGGDENVTEGELAAVSGVQQAPGVVPPARGHERTVRDPGVNMAVQSDRLTKRDGADTTSAGRSHG